MTEDGHSAVPQSLVLMSGPVDARVNPGPINRYAHLKPAALRERSVITTVPSSMRDTVGGCIPVSYSWPGSSA